MCLLLATAVTSQAALSPMYEVFLASYADGDGDRQGDLQGLRAKLDYIASLGVKSIWLMPIHPSPSYHKYDVTDYQGIDTSYGSLADFEALVIAAKQRGISLILDLVINHSSNHHPWFIKAVEGLKTGIPNPYQDYYLFNQTSGHAVPGISGWYYEGHFGAHMPELNLDNELLRQEIAGIIGFWLSQGAAGFRLDAATHYYEDNTSKNIAFLSWLNRQIKAINPEAFIIAEAWKDETTILSLYESGIDSLFNFPLSGASGSLMTNFRNKQGAAIAARADRWQGQILSRNSRGIDAPFLSNHDMGRSAGYLLYKSQAIKQAAALYLTMPGIPAIYYGEEIGMSGSGRDENKRLPMLWVEDESLNCLPPAGADQKQRLKESVRIQEEDPDSVLNFYRHLGRLRNLCPELENGFAEAVDTGEISIAAWKVTDFDKSVLVFHNLSGDSISLEQKTGQLLGGWDPAGRGIPSQSGDVLSLPPYSGCIIR